MKQLRVLFLLIMTFVSARLLSEAGSCPDWTSPVCSRGMTVIVPFFLSVYFIDSLMEFWDGAKSQKERFINLAFCTPYIFYTLFVVSQFFGSLTAVTIEYVVSVNLFYSALVYLAIYFLNLQPKVRRVNTVFMVTFLLSLGVFVLL